MPRPKYVQFLWESFRDTVLPKGAHATQVLETRRAFYAGAQALFSMVTHNLSSTGDDEPTEADLQMFTDIEDELRQFGSTVRDGFS